MKNVIAPPDLEDRGARCSTGEGYTVIFGAGGLVLPMVVLDFSAERAGAFTVGVDDETAEDVEVAL